MKLCAVMSDYGLQLVVKKENSKCDNSGGSNSG